MCITRFDGLAAKEILRVLEAVTATKVAFLRFCRQCCVYVGFLFCLSLKLD
jgi:hypothetical protein